MTRCLRIMVDRLPRASRWALVGLLVGILGLVIQAIADPSAFAVAMGAYRVPFPPGILVILFCGVLTVATSRWRWHPIFAVLVGVWIVGVGAKFLLPNLVSPHAGTVLGNVVMALGLIAAVVAGIIAMMAPRRDHHSPVSSDRPRGSS